VKYTIEKRQVYSVKVAVDAESEKDALKTVLEGGGTEIENSQELVDTVDPYGIGTQNAFEWWITDPKGNSKPISQI
jgi:hypothetical protein